MLKVKSLKRSELREDPAVAPMQLLSPSNERKLVDSWVAHFFGVLSASGWSTNETHLTSQSFFRHFLMSSEGEG